MIIACGSMGGALCWKLAFLQGDGERWADWPCSARTGTTGSGQPRGSGTGTGIDRPWQPRRVFRSTARKVFPVDPFGRSGLSNSFSAIRVRYAWDADPHG